MNVNEPVQLSRYQPEWPAQFLKERERIQRTLSPLANSIEHIGSTSIPGMTAKPILDILVGLHSFRPDPSLIAALVELGYVYMEESCVPGRLYFIKRSDPHCNVHVVQYKGEIWNDDLRFRNFLRDHPDWARKYAQLKQRITKNGVGTLLEYSAQKAPFIAEILKIV